MKLLRRAELSMFLLLLSLPGFTSANDLSGSGPHIDNPLKTKSLMAFVDNIIDAALDLGAIVAVLAIIYAGFMFVTASGDEEKIKTAKKILLYSVIGIAILLGARMISSIIVNTVTAVDQASR